MFIIKKVIWTFLIGIVFLTGCANTSGGLMYQQDPEKVNYEIEGNISDDEAAKDAVEVIETNLYMSQEKDIDEYLNTIVSRAHEQTRKELIHFFENYDLEHTLLSIEIIDQSEDTIRLSTAQQTIVLDAKDGVDEYRNHIAEVSYTLIKENNLWKIEESITNNLIFL